MGNDKRAYLNMKKPEKQASLVFFIFKIPGQPIVG